jgi:preprotein translocase subunit SecF
MDIWGETNIDFMGKRWILFTVSGIAAIIGLIAIIAIPLGKANLGTDFAGGIAIQFRFEKPVSIENVRILMEKGGLRDANLQQFAEPNKLLIRLKRSSGDLRAVSKSIGEVFANGIPDNHFTVESTTEIGPTVGKKLQSDALWAVGISMLGILIYVAWRFEFRFGVAAVIATLHDVLAVMGFLYIINKEMTLLIVTALLTLAGYSLTDTVVVFDRIRENMHKRTKEDLIPLINRSVNEVLHRTIVTSFTVVLTLTSLLLIGGEVIHDFALTLFAGVIVGTYSSIFIASPILLFWGDKKKPGPAGGRT